MNKRTRSIASMFANRPEGPELSADNPPPSPRVSSGSVRSMKDTFSQVEQENEALRQTLVEGRQVQEINPALVDPSPFADRFPEGDDEGAFEALKASIAQIGQEVPVLLRIHPQSPGRFQTAYGHRRVRAARALLRPVRAVVRDLDDGALAIAQGVENSARQDLTFIERAVFAARLEDGGAGRTVIQHALSIDKAETSKLLSIARAVPADLLRFIGRAPKIGRGRWQALAEALRQEGVPDQMRRVIAMQDFGSSGSDKRFALLMQAASSPKAAASERAVLDRDTGRRLATLVAGEREVRLVIGRELGRGFAEFVAERLYDLYADYASKHGTSNRPKAETSGGGEE